MYGCTGKPRSAATPSLPTILRNPAGVNGAPRSDVKINGDAGSCSRLSRRRARSSRPDNGWTDSAAGWGPEAPRFLDRLLASRWTTYWSYLESRYPQTFCGVHTYVVVA